ncbi:MAG: hypothetical protein Q9195_008535 [Heterodermia aff. obscurata]
MDVKSTIVASIIRAITYRQSTAVEFDKHTDTGILVTGAIYWSLIECGVGLISCCLPPTYGLLRRSVFKPNGASFRYHSSDQQYQLTARGGGFRRQVNGSQASDVELAAIHPAHTTSAEGPKPDEAREAMAMSPRNQILVTTTFAAEKQSTTSVQSV